LSKNFKNKQKGAPKNAFVNINKYEKEFGKFKMTSLNLKEGSLELSVEFFKL
jgi:hypothetical protein